MDYAKKVFELEGISYSDDLDFNSSEMIKTIFKLAEKHDCFPFKSIGNGWVVNVPGMPSGKTPQEAILKGVLFVKEHSA